MPNWKKVITSGSDAALNSLVVTSHFTASGLIYPSADNGEESFIQTDGNGNLSLQYVKTIYEEVVNGEATSIVKGTPVYVSGSVGAAAQVFRADAGNASKMPVIYVVADTIAAAATGRGIALGLIAGVDTTGYPAGTEIYVAVGGGWTSTRPTGSAIVQTLGYVTKEGAGGMGVILNPGPNNLPNLPAGNVWVGNSNALPVATATSSIQNVVSASFATTSTTATQTSQAVTFNNAGSGAASGTTFNGSSATTISHNTIGAVPTARTITINGVSQDLSANRTYSVGTVTSIATGNGIQGGTITTTGTLGLTGQALALHNLATNGVIARTGTGTVAARTITGTTNQITVTNGNGVSGNPTISLPATINVNTTGNAANVTGTVAVANGGTGQTTYTNGQLLIGNTTGNTLTKATLTAGSGITITNGNGSISIAATGGGIGGSGTTNRVAKFTGATTVGNSNISDDGTTITSIVNHTFNGNILNAPKTFSVISSATTGSVAGGDFDTTNLGDYAYRGGSSANTSYDNIVNIWGDSLLCNGQILNDCIAKGTIAAGELVYLRSDGEWEQANAASLNGSTTLLGIALKTVSAPALFSVLLDGIIHTLYHTQAQSATPGLPLYIDSTPGQVTETAPSTAGEFVRVVGHNIHDNSSGVVAIRFKPDNTWLEL